MFLVRLVYTSEITEGVTESDIQNILDKARKKNTALHVTGVLLFSRKYFLQCLEGSREQVNKVYHHILNDNRHKDVVLLDYSEVNEREFADWSMGYIPEMEITRPITLKYSESASFEPYSMSGSSAHNLLTSLTKAINVV
ncbi:BLUF domain-containing protein [Vibrio aquimaris]|uniref:Blue light-and temperature-regulated antirepressor YcgF n=1 Tax=Vibrio aquimaris TaxID=2587862 RepID=A0A5P9CKG7_9VIBR|nr:BLUF domain-containing protein [Vibrio aquimaris]QFT26423.1 Blue light- and temperature-regulated antirepressor YcgF [Vibrio aquimaris]